MLFSWFDAREAKAFGAALAASFIARVEPGMASTEKKFESRAKSAMKEMARQVAAFRTQHRLNVYKKAQLGNAFKWALKEAGYDAAYIDKLTDWLLLQL